jgi:hypothetical protein
VFTGGEREEKAWARFGRDDKFVVAILKPDQAEKKKQI